MALAGGQTGEPAVPRLLERSPSEGPADLLREASDALPPELMVTVAAFLAPSDDGVDAIGGLLAAGYQDARLAQLLEEAGDAQRQLRGQLPRLLEAVAPGLRTAYLCRLAVEAGARMDLVPQALRTSDVWQAALRHDGAALREMPQPLQTHEAGLTALVRSATRLAPGELPVHLAADGDFLLRAVREEPGLLPAMQGDMLARFHSARLAQGQPEDLGWEQVSDAILAFKAAPTFPVPEASWQAIVASNPFVLAHVPSDFWTAPASLLAARAGQLEAADIAQLPGHLEGQRDALAAALEQGLEFQHAVDAAVRDGADLQAAVLAGFDALAAGRPQAQVLAAIAAAPQAEN